MISSYRNTPSPSAVPEGLALVRYLDVVLVLLGAPILILMGASAVGYGVAAATWIVLRGVGLGLERYLASAGDPRREISLRLAYLLARIFLLALAVILVRRADGRDAALTALGVIVLAFTVHLAVGFIQRPRRSR